VVARFAASQLLPAAELFPDKLSDLGGRKLRAVTFHYPPKNVFERRPDGSWRHGGLETVLVQTFGTVINYVPEFTRPTDGGLWGRHEEDGTWSGLVGDLHYGRADVGMANLFISESKLEAIDMTTPYMTDYACYIAAVPPPPPRYLSLVRPLTWRTWLWTLGSFALVVPVLWGLAHGGDGAHNPFRSFTYSSFYAFGVLIQEAMHRLPRQLAAQLFLGLFFLFSVVISSAYRGNLIAYLMVPAPPTPLDTSRQLLASGLEWGVRRAAEWESWFQNSPDPIARRLADDIRFVGSFQEGIRRARDTNFAFINSKQSLQYLVATNFTDAMGEELMHVSRECYIPFSVALGLPKYSPLTSKFNLLIRRTIEAGLVDKYFKDVLESVRTQQGRRKAARESSTRQQPLNISHLQAPLGLYVIGLLLSLTAFVAEVGLKKLHATVATEVTTIPA
ncbi:ionotropic receptor 21a-like, partial [Pollicipes pollicipes]|uniref:ionotropic receptor 21a-like n=1 Tax=Pollicipes pollicipes TaxID=41117 RepID=UPI001884E1B4